MPSNQALTLNTAEQSMKNVQYWTKVMKLKKKKRALGVLYTGNQGHVMVYVIYGLAISLH